MSVSQWDVRRQVGLWVLAAVVWGAALAGVALGAQPTVQVRFDERLGFFLTGPDGRTLYVFARDVPGTIGPVRHRVTGFGHFNDR